MSFIVKLTGRKCFEDLLEWIESDVLAHDID